MTRPLKIDGEEVSRGNPMGKNSLVPAVQELWNTWEIHFLVLLSLSLQAFLFLFAGMRRRSSSRVLSIVLWLAYLSADSVAIFVLGHLAVRAGEPGHQLLAFWAPFVLVHLGGQDTITAFSKQDNELWLRHLLNLVTQATDAGYMVAKASWPDHRLRAAMVLMFLNGGFKYAERTGCLYFASPARLRSGIMSTLSETLKKFQGLKTDHGLRQKDNDNRVTPGQIFDDMSSSDIMSVDVPINETKIIIEHLDHLPDICMEFLSNPDRYDPYNLVGACLAGWYKRLYTKYPLREILLTLYRETFGKCSLRECCRCCCDGVICCLLVGCGCLPALLCLLLFLVLLLLYPLFQYVLAPVALVLFMASEKGGHLHASQTDITVSYILLVGAIVLDVSSGIISIFSFMISNLSDGGIIESTILHIANHIQPACSRKQWSEELAQYNMIKRHTTQDTSGMASIWQWIDKLLGSWGIDLCSVTHTPITKDDAPIKEFVLANLLHAGTRKEWNIASSRGQLAVQKWMTKSYEDPNSTTTGKALEKIITSGLDLPTSVLIWHIATDICYFFDDKASTSSSDGQLKKHKEMSRELSNYLMYLVFKCSVMLSSNSQIVHDNAHDEIRRTLSRKDQQAEKAVAMKIFEAVKEERQKDKSMVGTQKHKEPANNENNAADSHLQKLVQSAKAITSPVLPHAGEVAQALIDIEDEADRWDLIASVWSEMLFYTAPRCGCAFHTTGIWAFAVCQMHTAKAVLPTAKPLPWVTHGEAHTAKRGRQRVLCRVPFVGHTAKVRRVPIKHSAKRGFPEHKKSENK